MTPTALIAAVVWVATALWFYAGVAAVEWALHLRRTEPGARVATVVDLVGALVPMVIGYVALVFASVIFGFRSGVVALALVVPAGLAWALRSQIADHPPILSEPIRIAAALGLATLFQLIGAA